nr:TolC family protein [Vicinamibacteria bacterium]
MRQGSNTVFFCLVVCLPGTIASAQRSLTLPEALARAREQAPQIVSARLAIDESRGRLKGASVALSSNPEIDLGAGRRRGPDARFTDWEVGLQQAFEPPGRRSARIAGANASIAAGTAGLAEVTRAVLRDTAIAFYRALHANERVRLLAMSEEFARGLHAAADRRFKAGDVALLDVN